MITKNEEGLFLKPIRFYLSIIISGVIFGIALAYSLPPYLDLVEDLGHNVASDDITKDYAIALGWATFLGASILFWPVRREDKPHLLLAWFFKCIFVLFFLLFYDYKYLGDVEGYFRVGKSVLFEQLIIDDIEQGSRKGLGVISIFSQYMAGTWNVYMLILYYNKIVPDFIVNSYHSLNLSFSMVGFVGLYIFYRGAVLFFHI